MEYSNVVNQSLSHSTGEVSNTRDSPHGFAETSSSSYTSASSEKLKSGDMGSEDSLSESLSDEEPSVSDSESAVSSASYEQFQLFDEGLGLVKLVEGEKVYDIIKRKFMSSFERLGVQASVVSIHRHVYLGVKEQARLNSFQIYAKAVENKCGGNANIKYSWFGSSKDDITKIVSYGFGLHEMSQNNGLYGSGVYLTPDSSPLESACNSPVDKDGLRHLLLTRVIMGKSEVVPIGSEQCQPSSEEFDSGMDNLQTPTKYIVWSTHLNTHTLPEYVVSFRAPPSLAGFVRTKKQPCEPTSPWMPFPVLISELSKFLPPQSVSLIRKHHEAHKERKLSRNELIQRLRHLAGDRLLIATIKSFRTKQLKARTGLK
ncbi:putative inactive poly [ADP-ribose] polymerase SRO5 [Castanea sativa]|uniref:putative inactive poly [ADP-ribose] polymerase SRO5 n=1 Tax=Castanea sativa TaxID=21020 RepID=UPI003F6528A9